MEYAAYMDCRISDIERDALEISDADGEIICAFPWPEHIVYDGILTDSSGTPFTSYNKFMNCVVEGEPIGLSDIQIGDIVDVVYCYTLSHPAIELEKLPRFWEAMNVHKREGD